MTDIVSLTTLSGMKLPRLASVGKVRTLYMQVKLNLSKVDHLDPHMAGWLEGLNKLDFQIAELMEYVSTQTTMDEADWQKVDETLAQCLPQIKEDLEALGIPKWQQVIIGPVLVVKDDLAPSNAATNT
jgi:hypothetical protein